MEPYELLRGKNVRQMTTENLIEWVAALAHEGKEDWGFLKEEILRRCHDSQTEVGQ
jgi:hypothetical protein